MSSADWWVSADARVRFPVFVEQTDYCWLWTGGKNSSGYGVFSLLERGRSAYPAHRLAWEMEHGQFVSPGMQIDHTCGVRCCVRPSHLEEVTPAENTQRALWQLVCARGHDMTGDNRRVRRDINAGECKACAADGQRARRAKKKKEKVNA